MTVITALVYFTNPYKTLLNLITFHVSSTLKLCQTHPMLITLIHIHTILKGIVQLVRPEVCSLEVISSSLTNLGPLEAYMVVNFKACGISWGTHKLTRISTLIKKITHINTHLYFKQNLNQTQVSKFSLYLHHYIYIFVIMNKSCL
jgi:hypothetical protein